MLLFTAIHRHIYDLATSYLIAWVVHTTKVIHHIAMASPIASAGLLGAHAIAVQLLYWP